MPVSSGVPGQGDRPAVRVQWMRKIAKENGLDTKGPDVHDEDARWPDAEGNLTTMELRLGPPTTNHLG